MRILLPLLIVLLCSQPAEAKDWEVEVVTLEHYNFADLDKRECIHRYETYMGVRSGAALKRLRKLYAENPAIVLVDVQMSPVGDHSRRWVKLVWKD